MLISPQRRGELQIAVCVVVDVEPERLWEEHRIGPSAMLTSLRASFTQQRVIALGGALGAAGLASVWLVGAASCGPWQSDHGTDT